MSSEINRKLQAKINVLESAINRERIDYNKALKYWQDKYKKSTANNNHIYNSGYMEGHHDTVEGCFTDITTAEMNIYHSDKVRELVEYLNH